MRPLIQLVAVVSLVVFGGCGARQIGGGVPGISVSTADLTLACCDGGCSADVRGMLRVELVAENGEPLSSTIALKSLTLSTDQEVWADRDVELTRKDPEQPNLLADFDGVVEPGEQVALRIYASPEWTTPEADLLGVFGYADYKIELVLEANGQTLRLDHAFSGADTCGNWR